MHPAYHHYIELYHKLQHYTLLNNLFRQSAEYRDSYWILVNPSWQLLKIFEKEQAVNTFACRSAPLRKQMTITERKFISIKIDKSSFFSLTAIFFKCCFQRQRMYSMRMSNVRSHQLKISKINSDITTENYLKPNVLDGILTDDY